MAAQFHWDPETYLEKMQAEVPLFEELQAETIRAIPFPPKRVLELGVGTGETSRALLAAYPDAEITGLDSSPEMVFHARQSGIEVRLARMEDPLPDGPWDLVIAVLSVHHLDAEGKQDLFRRVREQARALVIGDVVLADPGTEQRTPIEPERDRPDTAEDLLAWSGGELRWRDGDLVVIAATYD
jgi:tRNA (cmo5U34)-methyltransferase